MDVMEYQARIAMMSGHHQSDTFWSNEMSMGTVMSIRDTTWLSYFHSLFHPLNGMSPVCPLDRFSYYTQCSASVYSFSYSLSQIWTSASPVFSIGKL